ncbi:hypothetical protein Asp14428_73590 [Actinoplanes sp. NBRC 14428]|nr:hypothetical protein Asp14428_73590 [Actinoplanes sp. NBRC 14428]
MEGVEPVAVTGQSLYDHFNTTLRGRTGQALIVFWAGHGLEYDHQQWLCLPEASATAMHAVNLTGEVMPTLAGSAYAFPEQYFFIDACRTRYDRLNLPRGPVERTFESAGGWGGNRQHALLASSSGTETMSLPSLSTSVFSRALREALRACAGFPWPMEEAADQVAAMIGRAPVRVTRRGPDGSVDDRLPAPPMTLEYADLAEIGKLLARVPRMTDHRTIARLVDVLEVVFGLPLEGPETPQDLVFRLGRAPSGMSRLLRLATDRADLFPEHHASTHALRARLEALGV